MATKAFLLYLISTFSVTILSVLFFTQYHKYAVFSSPNYDNHMQLASADKVWPALVFDWRIVLATVIGFLGSACGTVGGVGGGGIFVPMLTLIVGFFFFFFFGWKEALNGPTLIVGFDTKSAAAISKCMIMGASASSVWYNLRVPHPTKEVPILDYDLALLFQPMLMLGITIGVSLSVVFPYWLITVLIIFLFMGTSSRSAYRGVEMWKEETIMKKEYARQQESRLNSHGELLIDAEYHQLNSNEQKSVMQIVCFNLRWKRVMVLVTLWAAFLLLQILKNDTTTCSTLYWVLFCLQFPIAFLVFGYEANKLYKDYKKRLSTGNPESICEASITWTPLNITFCALCGILGGTVGGLLGSGGGFILGPLLHEIGVIPQVASATATFVMMFSASLSVVEFYLLKRFPLPYALYLTSVSILAGFWGQYLVRRIVTFLNRASIIVFILSAVIFASAITMGVTGIKSSIHMIQNGEFMGFLDYCSSQ